MKERDSMTKHWGIDGRPKVISDQIFWSKLLHQKDAVHFRLWRNQSCDGDE